MSDDLELLHRYAARGRDAQEAFATLVRRHVDLVYSVARRITRSPQEAEDVAQAVFTSLAAQARVLPADTILVAWLHVVTRRTAIDVVRRESRRRRRESAAEALVSSDSMPALHSPWSAIEPLLDEAVASLAPPDRTAVLLRYFQSKNLREVGAALGASEDAAQKRVTRAIEQLREFFVRRGIPISSTGLAADLLAHATFTAPAGLGALAASAGLAGAAHFVVMTTLQKTMLGGAAALAFGGVIVEGLHLSSSRAELSHLVPQIQSLQSEADQARQRLLQARERIAGAKAKPVSLPGVNTIAPEDAAMAAEIRAWFARVAHVRQIAARHPERMIPEMKLLTDEDWHSLGDADVPADNDEAAEKMLTQLRFKAKNRFGNELRQALNRYVSDQGGLLPKGLEQMAPYFSSPPDPAMLARYEIVQTGKLAEVNTQHPRHRTVIMEKPTDFDEAHLGITTVGFTMGPADLSIQTARATRRYEQSTGGTPPASAASLLPFFDPPLPAWLQERFLQQGSRYLSPPPAK